MVLAMVEIARALGLRTIAEFVESDAILQRLREFEVDFVQGYHVGRPAPVEEIAPIVHLEAEPEIRVSSASRRAARRPRSRSSS